MNSSEIEQALSDLSQNWPTESVADAVMARIGVEPAKRPAQATVRAWRIGLVASAAAASLALGIALFAMLTAPRTLQAQVEQALAQTSAAHITWWGLDEKGVRHEANIWYSRERGFRMESPEQILVDDGRQLWEWQPGDAADETPVVRRRSGDGRQMIAEMFAPLKDAPADLKPHRAAEHDREIGGVRCRGYVITPPAARELSDEGKLVPARYSQRTIVWTDPQDRLVETEQQRQVEGHWHSGFRTSIRYDVEVPGEKFVAKLSAKAKIVSPDMSLDQRFPLAAALATKESEGLLFAIHEAERMEGGLIYIVSSVRGTPAYLKAHPPAHRRFNLTTTLLDVAYVPNTARNMDADWNVAALASAELDGVYYSWWLAVPRVSYILKDGVEILLDDPPDPKATEKAHLTLHAHPWALRDSRGHVPTVTATFDLSTPDKSTTLNQIAARVLADANDLTAHGVGVALSGGIDKNKMRAMPPHGVQVDHYVAEIRSQLAWCHKTDDVTDLNHSPPPR